MKLRLTVPGWTPTLGPAIICREWAVLHDPYYLECVCCSSQTGDNRVWNGKANTAI
jgi:hypothetical protein